MGDRSKGAEKIEKTKRTGKKLLRNIFLKVLYKIENISRRDTTALLD
jgi:hypothetical protein